MPDEIRIATPQGECAARAWGPTDGQPVLALHGWLDNAASFDALAPLLPNLRLVALDLPGHGLSAHAPPGALYPFLDYVACVHAVLDELQWSRASLLGHSLGAAVCSIFAGTFAERVERLALIEGLGPLSEDPKHAPERLAKSLREQHRKRNRVAPVHATVDEAVRRRLAAPSAMKPDSVRTLLSRGLMPTEGGVTWRSDPALRVMSRLRLSEPQVLAFLGQIACPTLLVRGDSGYPFVPDIASARVAAVSQLQVAALTGGHHLHLDEPESVAAPLREFFAAPAA